MKVFSYYSPDERQKLSDYTQQALKWDKNWSDHGWNTVTLGVWHVVGHPMEKAMASRLQKLKATDAMMHAYGRYMAMDSIGEGGYLSHIDCLNGGLVHREMMDKTMVSMDSTSDCLLYAQARVYTQFVSVLMDALSGPLVLHPWQVLLTWHRLYMLDGLVSRFGPSELIHQQINHE